MLGAPHHSEQAQNDELVRLAVWRVRVDISTRHQTVNNSNIIFQQILKLIKRKETSISPKVLQKLAFIAAEKLNKLSE